MYKKSKNTRESLVIINIIKYIKDTDLKLYTWRNTFFITVKVNMAHYKNKVYVHIGRS